MDLEERARRQNRRVIISEIIMVVAVIVTAGILALVVSGYWLNADFEVERQGMLQISSVPTGANVEVDGESSWLQRTNTSKVVASGEHTIVLTKDGYDSWSKTVNVNEGLLYRLHYPRLFLLDRTAEDVYEVSEDVIYKTFTKFSSKKVSPKPFRRITYKEAMLKYGTDKPDLRNPLEIIDLTDSFKNTTFKPFLGSVVRGIKVDDIASKSNSWFNELVDYAKKIGMPGIGYISVLDDMTFKGPIDKFLSDAEREELIEKADLKKGSVLFFIADKKELTASTQAGLIRTALAERLDLIDNNRFEFCFIVDFPMYEYSEEEGKYIFTHNPFSMPQGGMDALENQKIEDILAYQYDIVCNGVELSSGAVRNHDVKIMEKAFEIAGYTKEELENRFKSLYTAFHYGAPPHAGIAPGIDRMIMLLKDEPNIREVIAFPLNSNAQDMMMGAPSEVTEKQLREIHIKIR